MGVILLAVTAVAEMPGHGFVDEATTLQSGNENTGRLVEGKTKIYNIGHGVTAPKFIPTGNEASPNPVLKAKKKGAVLLEIIIDEQGKPRNVQIIRSHGEDVDKKAIDAVTKWRFEPAMKDGQPVAVRIAVRVDFQLY